MRRFIVLLLLLNVFGFVSNAQNNLEIASIRSPQFNFNYSEDDSINVEVSLLNKGPNTIFSADQINFDVKLATVDTTIFFNITRVANVNIPVNGAAIYTLIQDYKLGTTNDYQLCVSVSGTVQYPSNTSKESGPCIAFVVSLGERQIKAEKIFYQENRLNFSLASSPINTQFRIMDMSGKVLNSGLLKRNSDQSIHFAAPARGLYFLQLQNNNGQQSTHKFVVR